MAKYITVHQKQVFPCKTCGQPLTIVENRHGKRLAVEAVRTPDDRQWAYTRSGAYDNWLNIHQCKPLDATRGRRAEFDRLAATYLTRLTNLTLNDPAAAIGEEFKAVHAEYRNLCLQYGDVTGTKAEAVR